MQQGPGPVMQAHRGSVMMPLQPEVDFSEKESHWSPLVNWSAVQSNVVAMAFDVLILIDGYEAAGAILHTDTSHPRARNEIIAACPPNISKNRPPRVNIYRNRNSLTYTRALAQMLINRARSNREFTVARLRFDVTNYLLNERYQEGHIGRLHIIPQYFVIPGRPRQPGISLRVLPRIDRTGADDHDPLNSYQANDDDSLEDDDLFEEEEEVVVEEEYLDRGEGASHVHLTAIAESATNVNQDSSLDREDQHDGETTAPAPTSQTHAPIHDESVPQGDRNSLKTGFVEARELLRLVNQLIETTQTPSYAKLKRRVKTHRRELQHHFDEEVRLEPSIESRRIEGRRRAELNEELDS
jgi:hypothetical protein